MATRLSQHVLPSGSTSEAYASSPFFTLTSTLYWIFAHQPYWSRRVRQLGIGHAHAPGLPTPDSLASALDQVLHPDVAVRARDVAEMMRRDGARDAAERLLRGAFRAS
jgi:UDP:flavonoid glycosyltransferase YjiC (YdhE family)